MARTFSALVVDDQEWRLSDVASSQLIKKLRQRGFYANFRTLPELELHCVRFSRDPHAESLRAHGDGKQATAASSLFSEAHPSSEATNVCQAEQVMQSPTMENANNATAFIRNPAENPDASSPINFPCLELSEDAKIDKWCLIGKDGETVPIIELPYNVSGTNEISLSGYITAKQQEFRTGIQKWKFVSVAEKELAIYVKTTTESTWCRLGSPLADYGTTIKNVLIYMHLFSMPKEAVASTKEILIHLQKTFQYCPHKPNLSDLRESLLLAMKLDFSSIFPIDGVVLSSMLEEIEGIALSDEGLKMQNVEIGSQEVAGGSVDKSTTSALGSDSNGVLQKSNRAEGTLDDQSRDFSVDNIDFGLCHNGTRLLALREPNESSQITEDSTLPVTKTCGLRKRAALEPPVGDFETRFTVGEDLIDGGEIDLMQNLSEPDRIKDRIRGLMKECVADSGQPGKRCNYSCGPFVAVSKLWAITSAAQEALNYLDGGGSVEDAMKICPKAFVDDFFVNEVKLKEYRLSKFFPPPSKKKEIAEKINYYANDGDMVVEIHSQNADYFSHLREKLSSLGKHCDYRKYNVDQLQNKDIRELMSIEGFPTGSKLLVCLSFSFYVSAELSNTILDYTVELKPKLIVVIAPLFSRRLEEHSSYNPVWVDSEILKNEILWPWGLMDVADVDLEKRNGVSPIMYVWSRADWMWKHQHIASRFGHREKSGLTSHKN